MIMNFLKQVMSWVVLILLCSFIFYAIINCEVPKNNIRKHCEQRLGEMHYDTYCILPNGEKMKLTFSEITEK